MMIRVLLPQHLRTLAHVGSEVTLDIEGAVTLRAALDALEARYPMLRGTIRDHGTQQRRPFLRFFACEEDLSHESPDSPLPEAVTSGKEPLVILGAIAGGEKENFHQKAAKNFTLYMTQTNPPTNQFHIFQANPRRTRL